MTCCLQSSMLAFYGPFVSVRAAQVWCPGFGPGLLPACATVVRAVRDVQQLFHPCGPYLKPIGLRALHAACSVCVLVWLRWERG